MAGWPTIPSAEDPSPDLVPELVSSRSEASVACEARQGLDVVVLTCGDLGRQVAGRLQGLDSVRRVTLVSTPYKSRRLGLMAKVRRMHRMQGWQGVLRAAGKRVIDLPGRRVEPEHDVPDPAVRHLRFEDFHAPECVRALRELRPDLGVLAGTYILGESVFSIPPLGSINLHCGKVPEYRGSAPGFWEIYHGESSVGVTVHRVTADLDSGGVLAQELFPLNPAPPGDPLTCLEELRRDVLLPNGVRMLAEAVEALAQGAARERPQDQEVARTFPSPDHRAVRELRRRVARRRVGRTRS